VNGHNSGFQPWVVPVQMGFFAVAVIVAALIVIDLVRRPEARFLSRWPAPRARWAIVPGAFLAVIAAQVLLVGLAALPDRSLFASVSAAITPANAALGLATFLLGLATLVEGIVYLLRVVFPAPRRLAEDARDAAVDGDDSDAAEGAVPSDAVSGDDPEAP
jgi:hypothetical protein